MVSIFKREINAFFSSLIGYIAIGIFLVTLGLFLWVFPDSSLLNYGYATMDTFFSMAPYIFLLLIPAITMRSLAEETQSGTIELLATKPVTELQIILGKYFASLFLVFFAVLPTLVYFYTLYQLGTPKGNLDSGAIAGSYFGLMFIGGAFVAIGMFASSLTNNQIIAFLLALFLCFFLLWAFDYLKNLPVFIGRTDHIVEMIGMSFHYDTLSKGLIDSRDVIYFLSLIAGFLTLTKFSLERRKW